MVRCNDCRKVEDGGVGPCHAESVGIILHVNGDVPGLLHLSSFLNQEWDEPGGNVLPELWWNSLLLHFASPLVSLPLAEYWANRVSALLPSSSSVMSSCVTSLQYGVF